MSPGGELLTFAQAAERLGVDVWTIRRWVRTEQCPVVCDGRRVRIPFAWVDDPRGWLDRF
jgi:excisionase family DNA binding protein